METGSRESVHLWTSVELVGRDAKSGGCDVMFHGRLVSVPLTLSNPMALVCPTRDEMLLTSLRIRCGGRVASTASGDCTAESECCCCQSSVAESVDERASTDEKDGCRSDRLGKATCVLMHGRRLLRVSQESREIRVGSVSETAWSFVVGSGVNGRGHCSSRCGRCP